ncbi:MAG: acyl-CoA desaturase [Rhodobacteraceae bacterium]|nr:acyl-CoA desaturase [Paracoccaceae bacterium]
MSETRDFDPMELGPEQTDHGAVPVGITVDQGRLRGPQKVHAIAIAILPAIGTVAALWIAFTQGVSTLDLALCAVFYSITMLGISVGFHRQFSHRSFKTTTPIRVALAIAGSMAAQGSVVYWISNHRRHHQYTDKAGDIHSPYMDEEREMGIIEGFWHSHMGWTFDHSMTNALMYAKDLYRDPAIARVNQLYYVWVFGGMIVPAVIGGLATLSWWGAFTAFLWGGMVRMFLCYHFTNGIDSVTHIFGTRPFKSGDHSTNNAVWALPTMGEGWHNNHHTFPSSAVFGLTWWQLDPGAWLLYGLKSVGLVWDIQRPSEKMISDKQKVES